MLLNSITPFLHAEFAEWRRCLIRQMFGRVVLNIRVLRSRYVLKSAILGFTATFLAASALCASPGKGDVTLEIVSRYITATEAQKGKLVGVQMDVDFDAKIPKLQKQGKLQALRNISQLGKITYIVRTFVGDNAVKKELIARYMEAEAKAAESGTTMKISTDNYKFKYKGSMPFSGHTVQVLQLSPRKKLVGLFKGELWIDSETGLPVREIGEFVKSPSVFLKTVKFVRDYEIRDGLSIPSHVASTVDTRLVGKAELSIVFTNFSVAGPASEEVPANDQDAR
jgi:hypothetical protein